MIPIQKRIRIPSKIVDFLFKLICLTAPKNLLQSVHNFISVILDTKKQTDKRTDPDSRNIISSAEIINPTLDTQECRQIEPLCTVKVSTNRSKGRWANYTLCVAIMAQLGDTI